MSLEHDTHSHQPAQVGEANMVDRKLGNSARRRLLQGAIAAPAVLALHTGHATAMASNLNCVIKQVNSPVAPGVGPADNYIRVQLYSLRPTQPSADVRYYISGTDIAALSSGSGATNSYLTTGQWVQFDINNPSVVFTPSAIVPKWSDDDVGILTQDGPWVAVRFDADSMGVYILGVVQQGSGSAVAQSCWSSFTQFA